MTSYFTLCEDMEQLKAQMNILMSHLRKNEIITEEMVRHSVQTRMKKILPSRIKEYVALFIVAGFMPAYLIFCYYCGKITSLTFVIATILMCAYTTFWTLYGKYSNLRNVCKNGTLTEVATQVARMRRQNNIVSITTPLVFVAWCTVYFTIYFRDLVQGEMTQLVIALIIILVVATDIIYGLYRVRRITSEVLNEINELKQSK